MDMLLAYLVVGDLASLEAYIYSKWVSQNFDEHYGQEIAKWSKRAMFFLTLTAWLYVVDLFAIRDPITG